MDLLQVLRRGKAPMVTATLALGAYQQRLAEQFGISVADTVVFVYGDRTKYVTSDQMAEMDYSMDKEAA